MTNQINVIQLNNSSILYTKLVPTTSSFIGQQPTLGGNKQYLQISKEHELHLIETVTIMGEVYRGVTRDNTFWFLVEDLIKLPKTGLPTNKDSRDRLTQIEKLLNNIDSSNKGFIQCVDSRGDREFMLMVSIKGLRGKLFS